MAIGLDVAIALQQAGIDIDGLNGPQRKAVQQLLARAIDNGWSTETTARRLVPVIGLGPRYANAVEHFRQGLQNGITVNTKNGPHRRKLNARQIEQRVNNYTKRLLLSRARTIAQTEVAQVRNEALQVHAQRDQALGTVPVNTKLVFHLGTNQKHCAVCLALNGKKLPLHTNKIPPLHPNCACYLTVDSGRRAIQKDEYGDMSDPTKEFSRRRSDDPEHHHDIECDGPDYSDIITKLAGAKKVQKDRSQAWRTEARNRIGEWTRGGSFFSAHLQSLFPHLKAADFKAIEGRVRKLDSLGDTNHVKPEELMMLQAHTHERIKSMPIPTVDRLAANIFSIKKTKRPGGDFRGNTEGRRGRAVNLVLRDYSVGSWDHTGCHHCGVKVFHHPTNKQEKLEQDKLLVGGHGGRYEYFNITPSCTKCNKEKSDSPSFLGEPNWINSAEFKKRLLKATIMAERDFKRHTKDVERIMRETGKDKEEAQKQGVAWHPKYADSRNYKPFDTPPKIPKPMSQM